MGPALTITTAVLGAGFSVLMLSSFKMNFDLGYITAMTITIALIIDFLLLPALLLTFDKGHYPVPQSDDHQNDSLENPVLKQA